jgi:hypothetical protein
MLPPQHREYQETPAASCPAEAQEPTSYRLRPMVWKGFVTYFDGSVANAIRTSDWETPNCLAMQNSKIGVRENFAICPSKWVFRNLIYHRKHVRFMPRTEYGSCLEASTLPMEK